MKKWCLITSILIVTLLVAGCDVINLTPTPPPAGELEILSHSMTTGDFGCAEVKVTAKNVSCSTIGFAEIRVKFYDAEGNLLETSSDGIAHLRLGESWNFKIRCSGKGCERVKSYKITAIATTTSAD